MAIDRKILFEQKIKNEPCNVADKIVESSKNLGSAPSF